MVEEVEDFNVRKPPPLEPYPYISESESMNKRFVLRDYRYLNPEEVGNLTKFSPQNRGTMTVMSVSGYTSPFYDVKLNDYGSNYMGSDSSYLGCCSTAYEHRSIPLSIISAPRTTYYMNFSDEINEGELNSLPVLSSQTQTKSLFQSVPRHSKHNVLADISPRSDVFDDENRDII